MGNTRERLVDAALELFWFRGYEVTSLSEVCRQAGANPGSLYHYFPSKEQLLEADLDAVATFVLTTMEGGVMLARAYRSLEPFDRSVSCLREYVETLQATSGPSPLTPCSASPRPRR